MGSSPRTPHTRAMVPLPPSLVDVRSIFGRSDAVASTVHLMSDRGGVFFGSQREWEVTNFVLGQIMQ